MNKKTKNNIKKYAIIICIIAFACITSYFLDFNNMNNVENVDNLAIENVESRKDNDSSSSTFVEGKLQIHYVDVGQADAIVIEQGEHAMLIDAGKNDTEDSLINYINSLGITKFEYIIGTHVHEDHIGGMDKVVYTYDFDKIFFPKQISTTATFKNFVKAVKSKNKQLHAPNVGEKYTLGDATFEILAPNSSDYEDANNYSIVIKLIYGSKSFLFMGDAEDVSEREILSHNFDIKCDVLKLGHHGSYSSTTDEFLDKVNPEACIISCGMNNSYKHPSKVTMQKLKKRQIPVYRTDESGTIVINCDGDNISFNVEKGSYNYGK